MAQLISLALMPFLTRAYLPSHFGIYAVFSSLSSVAVLIATLRFDAAVILPTADQEARALVKAATLFSLISSTLAGCVVFFTVKYWLPEISENALFFSLLFAGSTLISGVSQALVNWFARHKKFRLIAIRNFTDRLASTPLSLVLAYLGLPTMGLMIGHFTGIAVSSLILMVGYILDPERKPVSNRELIHSIRKYKDFPLKSSWSSLFTLAAWQTPSLILSRFFPSSQIGILNLAARLLEAPIFLVGTSFSLAFYQRSSRASGTELIRLIKKTMLAVLLAAAVGSLGLYLVSDHLFELIFGRGWGDTGSLIKVLFPLYIVRLAYVSQAPVFYVLRKLSTEFAATLGLLISQASVCYWGAKFGLSIRQIATYLAISAAVIIGLTIRRLLRAARFHEGSSSNPAA